MIGLTKIKIKTSKKTYKISLYPVHIGCSDISDITMRIEKSNHHILHKNISYNDSCASQHSTLWHLSFPLLKFTFLSVSQRKKKDRWIERDKCSKTTLHPPGIWYFVYFSCESPCLEQGFASGAQAMYIVCSDTSAIVINFPKSKTHAITDTYCISLATGQLICVGIHWDQLCSNKRDRKKNTAIKLLQTFTLRKLFVIFSGNQ